MLKKTLDRSEAGDNVGVLLRGADRALVERGRVLRKPQSAKPYSTFAAEVYALRKGEGGQHTPFLTTTSPSSILEPPTLLAQLACKKGTEMALPGDATCVTVKLVAPVALEERLRFAIREGGRTVGASVVTKLVA